MPFVQINVPAGALSAEQMNKMIRLVTDAVVEAEGVPEVRAATQVLINEIVDGGWGVGGKAWTYADMAARFGIGAKVS